MTVIHFIVNPVSGKGLGGRLSEEWLQEFFGMEYAITVKYSKRKYHAKKLAKKSLAKNPDIIVACGGDGTINEVGRYLVGTGMTMGVVAIGSGNGLSHHMHYGKSIESDLERIKKGVTGSIDVGVINGKFFFSNFGLGFAADVVEHYEKNKSRKLWGYFKAGFFSWLKINKEHRFTVKQEGLDDIECSQIFCSNTNEMGYGMSITPNASVTDGFLDLAIFSPENKIHFIRQCIQILTHRHLKDKDFYMNKVREFTIITGGNVPVQIDGEYHIMDEEKLHVNLIREGLKLIY